MPGVLDWLRSKVSLMKDIFAAFLLAASATTCLAQQQATNTETSADPKTILTAAAPFYRLTDAGQHPWYLKATYQVFDNQGKPSEEATYEYWWSAPEHYRASWTRKGVSASVWVNGNGSAVFSGHPESLGFPEGRLGMAIAPIVPSPEDADKFTLNYAPLDLGGAQLRCVKLSPKASPENGGYGIALTPRFSGLCMEPAKPLIRVMISGNGEMVRLGDIELFHGQYLARQLSMDRGKVRNWDAKIVEAKDVDASDPALIPPTNAKALHTAVPVSNYPSIQPSMSAPNGSIVRGTLTSEEVTSGLLKAPVQPALPAGLDAKRFARAKVIFEVIIDGTGKVRFAKALSGPTELQKAALEALMQCEYRPMHTTDWQPLEIESKVTIKF